MRLLLLLTTLPALAQDNPRLEFAKGLLDQSRGKQEEALARFETARKADPTAAPLVHRAAARLLAEGELAKAVTLYRELAAATPERLDNQLAYSDFLRNEGRGDGLAEKLASEALEMALKRFPANPAILDRLFRSSQARGETERSKQLFERLVGQTPLNPAAMLMAERWSNVLFAANDAAASERLAKLFQESAAAFPAHSGLARAASDHFRKNNQMDVAIAILRQHAEAAPADLDLRTRLGILLFATNQDAAGEAALNEVIAIDPRRAIAHDALAKFYRQHNQAKPALEHADEVLRIRGGDPAAFLSLADEWLAADQPKTARILLEKAAYDHPANPEIAAKLAIATRRDPETRPRASRLFREAESLIPTGATPDPAFLSESADALLDEKRISAAEDRLRKAIRSFPPEAKKETAATLRKLAGLWESQNKNADAARSLRQRADTLDPK
ncbi:tetratricopeptide repeat protein [Luteolibacter sp. LG18]|uniref:tetratricopeptide repeat protein n=1 Tax=Luteolibacter sp. LG18 TaxID=2819286 RepID=UPI002B312136|nr:hypothetical protein llg_08480 [Luteolibacter sp. LG18]